MQLTFSDPSLLPNQIVLSQSDTDLSSIRTFLSYNNNLPTKAFSVSWSLNDAIYGRAGVTLVLDPLRNGIRSAIRPDQGNDNLY